MWATFAVCNSRVVLLFLSMSLSSSRYLVGSLGRRSSVVPVEVGFFKPEI